MSTNKILHLLEELLGDHIFISLQALSREHYKSVIPRAQKTLLVREPIYFAVHDILMEFRDTKYYKHYSLDRANLESMNHLHWFTISLNWKKLF